MNAPPRAIVRELRWTDFDDLVETYWSLYDERARGEVTGITLFAERPSRADEVAWFAKLYPRALNGELVAVVADVGGQAMGLCEIHPAGLPGRHTETSHVGELGILVNQGHRGKGLGTALIIRALELARSRFEIVRLRVFTTNRRAKRLYERLGFETSGRLPFAVRRGSVYIDEEEMYVDLRRWTPPVPMPNPPGGSSGSPSAR